ncbi:hypothetical protein CEXT_490061 [Caerostris extrusa]|uniref:Uncharacterized protein n=1 Tax=Caerostris extrusa TaxID=172846 RepID=A0AAV4R084_CAEEX|nr:hypothetical protein CEXT_490061 [Caerostris extrusa]
MIKNTRREEEVALSGRNTPSSPRKIPGHPRVSDDRGKGPGGAVVLTAVITLREKSSFISGSHLPAQISRPGLLEYLGGLRPHPAPLIAGIRYLMNARFPGGGGVPQEKGFVVFRAGRQD